jgi:hypothetical protein
MRGGGGGGGGGGGALQCPIFPHRYLLEVLRTTFLFEDLYTLGAFYHFVCAQRDWEFSVVRVQNNIAPRVRRHSAPTNSDGGSGDGGDDGTSVKGAELTKEIRASIVLNVQFTDTIGNTPYVAAIELMLHELLPVHAAQQMLLGVVRVSGRIFGFSFRCDFRLCVYLSFFFCAFCFCFFCVCVFCVVWLCVFVFALSCVVLVVVSLHAAVTAAVALIAGAAAASIAVAALAH